MLQNHSNFTQKNKLPLKQKIKDLQTLLPDTQTAVRYGFLTQIQAIQKIANKSHALSPLEIEHLEKKYNLLSEKIKNSINAVILKQNQFPKPSYDMALPVSLAKQEIFQAIKNNQVTVICGATGSGKTTQIAKICLELGIGSKGLIGHTQPRRIAARTVAIRIAEELGVEIGGFVGFKMRFSDQTNPNTAIKLMTDGILLAELTNDRFLSQYEAIIIDEAHERSLNIDFLMGILKQILPKRPDLKVIITSATIDPKRFAMHFERTGHTVPIIEVSGRTYPVEIRYRPLINDDTVEQHSLEPLHYIEGILEAVDELWRETKLHQEGDILVFLSGEREIRETAEALRKHHPPHIEVLPLFARLSQAEQNRIFKTTGTRRIVLATNVAETSLTVPGIKYVIDTGFARISRYNPRTRLQRLPIEAISRAAANQRSGRCGRVSNGICIRLYSEADFNQREEFLDPEIKRTHLAAVVLQMAHLRLGDPMLFPFIEAPDTRQIQDAYKALYEIRAIDTNNSLTPLGKKLARLPIDPRLGAMILNANDQNVLHEVLVLVSVLSIQDPRERPLEFQQKADEQHRQFNHPHSDFISLLNLWAWYQEQARHLSQNQLNQLTKKHFLSVARMREWKDLLKQLLGLMNEIDLKVHDFPKYKPLLDSVHHSNPAEKAAPENTTNMHDNHSAYLFPNFKIDNIHQALLAGLLDQVGRLGDEGFYLGANNRKFKLFPGSALRKKQPKWLMAMEIVETSQVYARTCAVIDPLWLEPIAAHLIKTTYSEPHWSKTNGMVKAYATLTLLGLPIVSKRSVHYGPIDPVVSREILIRDGLVTGEINVRANFLKHNQTKILEVEALEDKIRRRDILVEEWQLFEWYNHRLPTEITTAAALDKWCTLKYQPDPILNTQCTQFKLNNDRLKLELVDLIARDPNLELMDYPPEISINQLNLSAIYKFEPSDIDDGMTLIVPLAALNLLNKTRLDWLVPGFILDKIIGIIRSLPKSIRRHLVPAPDFAQNTLAQLTFGHENLYAECARILSKLSGHSIDMHDFNENNLDKHLRMNIRVVDHGGKTIAEGRDLYQLQDQFKEQAQNAFAALLKAPEKKLNNNRSNNQSKNQSNNNQLENKKIKNKDAFQANYTDTDTHSNSADSISANKTEQIWTANHWILEEKLSFTRNGVVLTGFPALIIQHSETVGNQSTLSPLTLKTVIFDQAHLAQSQLKTTLLTLAQHALGDKIKYLTKQWPNFGKLALMFRAVGTESALKTDLLQAVILDSILLDPLPLTAQEFNTRVTKASNEMINHANELSKIIIETLTILSTIKQSLHALHTKNIILLEKSINNHIKRLVFDGFVSQTPQKWRIHLPRYMKALATRIERASQNIERDQIYDNIIQMHLNNYSEGLIRIQQRSLNVPDIEEYRYLIEELSVSLFAQPMKTAVPISEKRLDKIWEGISKTIKDATA